MVELPVYHRWNQDFFTRDAPCSQGVESISARHFFKLAHSEAPIGRTCPVNLSPSWIIRLQTGEQLRQGERTATVRFFGATFHCFKALLGGLQYRCLNPF